MKILVTIDFSDMTEKVIRESQSLAQAMSAELCLLHVAEPHPDHITYDYDPAAMYAVDPSEIRHKIAEQFHKEHKTLQKYAEELRSSGVECKALMVQGETVDMIMQGVDKLGTDFVVAGSHGKGIVSQILLGSTSEELVRKTKVPVYLIPTS